MENVKEIRLCIDAEDDDWLVFSIDKDFHIFSNPQRTNQGFFKEDVNLNVAKSLRDFLIYALAGK